MSESTGIAILIMLMSISIGITALATNINRQECKDCPTLFDIQNNSTITYYIYDVQDRKECEEKYPMGYYHTMIGNKCKVTFWKSDLDK